MLFLSWVLNMSWLLNLLVWVEYNHIWVKFVSIYIVHLINKLFFRLTYIIWIWFVLIYLIVMLINLIIIIKILNSYLIHFKFNFK